MEREAEAETLLASDFRSRDGMPRRTSGPKRTRARSRGRSKEVRQPARSGSDYIVSKIAGQKAGRGMIAWAKELKNQVIQPIYDPRYLMNLPLNEPMLYAGIWAIVVQVTKRGDELKPRFIRKCALCGKEYDSDVEKCEEVGGGCGFGSVSAGTMKEPDATQEKRFRKFIEHINPTRQWQDLLRDTFYRQVGVCLTTWELVRTDPLDPKSPVVEVEVLPAERMRIHLGPKGMPGDPEELFCPKCVRDDPKVAAKPLAKDIKACPRCKGEVLPTAWTMLGPNMDDRLVVMRWAPHEIAWYESRGGHSPLVALVDTCQLTISMRVYQRAAYTNGAPLDRMVLFKGVEQDEVDEKHDDVQSARDNNPRGNVEVWMGLGAQSEVEVKELMPSLKDMMLTAAYDRLRDEIAAALGVSKEALGMQQAGKLGSPEEVLTISLDTAEFWSSGFENFMDNQILTLPQLGITDFTYGLVRPDLKDEKAEEEILNMRQTRMLALLAQGFDVTITDQDTMQFEVSEKPVPKVLKVPGMGGETDHAGAMARARIRDREGNGAGTVPSQEEPEEDEEEEGEEEKPSKPSKKPPWER